MSTDKYDDLTGPLRQVQALESIAASLQCLADGFMAITQAVDPEPTSKETFPVIDITKLRTRVNDLAVQLRNRMGAEFTRDLLADVTGMPGIKLTDVPDDKLWLTALRLSYVIGNES